VSTGVSAHEEQTQTHSVPSESARRSNGLVQTAWGGAGKTGDTETEKHARNRGEHELVDAEDDAGDARGPDGGPLEDAAEGEVLCGRALVVR
jgi:hypothetical protein